MTTTPKSPPPASNTQELLAIMDDIIRAYKKIVMRDEPEVQKLLREYTKCFVTAGAIVAKLNRGK